MIQEWQWMALALIAVTFAGTLRSISLTWAGLGATVVGALVWADPSFPILYQFLILGAIVIGGVAVTRLVVKPKVAAEEEDAPSSPAPNPRHVVNRNFTLSEPIVNGFGQIEIEGVIWRVRGEDAAAGEQIHVLGVDGLERDLLIVTKLE